MKIAIVFSLPTKRAKATRYVATDEDTKTSAEEVAAALMHHGVHADLVPITENSIKKVTAVEADCIINLIEWDGLDLPLTALAMRILEARNIPFTGSSRHSVLVANDKRKMKRILSRAGLPTPAWQVFTTGHEQVDKSLRYPLIVKLTLEHCSVGLSPYAVVSHPHRLRHEIRSRIEQFHQPVYIEEFIDGTELQVTLLEVGRAVCVLPPAEIVFHGSDAPSFLTYESRWVESHADYHASDINVAKISPSLLNTIETFARNAFSTFGFRDYSRLDMRIQEGKPYILEANANPGLGDDEDYGMTISYQSAGMTFADFVWQIVASCMRRWNRAGF